MLEIYYYVRVSSEQEDKMQNEIEIFTKYVVPPEIFFSEVQSAASSENRPIF